MKTAKQLLQEMVEDERLNGSDELADEIERLDPEGEDIARELLDVLRELFER